MLQKKSRPLSNKSIKKSAYNQKVGTPKRKRRRVNSSRRKRNPLN
jgi:hypothetical protein